MNAQHALEVAGHCAELVALCARFQATFGRRPTLKPGSPGAEWQMYHAIMEKQSQIAALLEPSVVKTPGEAVNQWWKRQDVIDLSIASDILKESGRLIACCAYLDADPVADQWSYTVQAAQSAIAMQLHPQARTQALEMPTAAAD